MGVDLATSARRWGRTGVLTLLLVGACSSAGGARSSSAGRVDAFGRGRAARPAQASADIPISPPPAVFTGPAPSAPPPATLSSPSSASGTGIWAVVIGVDDYPGSGHDLEYARNDASDVDAVLADAGQPAGQRVDLVDGQASAATIRRAIDWLVAHAGPDATAVFFYAGHVRKLGPTTEAMVGADGQLVTDGDLAGHLARLAAARTWLVIAGCYGGGFTEALAPGRILTAAAPANALAYETSTYHRSYLDEYLIRRGMLEGLGGPSVQSAFSYATNALRQEHPDRMPVEYDDASGPLVLGVAGSVHRPPPPPPSTTTTTVSRSGSPPRQASPPTTQQPTQEQHCIVTAGTLVRCPD